MTDKIEYPVTEEIVELFLEHTAALECRDAAIKQVFSTKKALNYSIIAERARDKAWGLIFSLYPDLKGKAVTFDKFKKVVHLT